MAITYRRASTNRGLSLAVVSSAELTVRVSGKVDDKTLRYVAPAANISTTNNTVYTLRKCTLRIHTGSDSPCRIYASRLALRNSCLCRKRKPMVKFVERPCETCAFHRIADDTRAAANLMRTRLGAAHHHAGQAAELTEGCSNFRREMQVTPLVYTLTPHDGSRQ